MFVLVELIQLVLQSYEKIRKPIPYLRQNSYVNVCVQTNSATANELASSSIAGDMEDFKCNTFIYIRIVVCAESSNRQRWCGHGGPDDSDRHYDGEDIVPDPDGRVVTKNNYC